MPTDVIDSPEVILARLAALVLVGGVLPQLLGLLARGTRVRAKPWRVILGIIVPAMAFFAISLVFFSTQAAAHVAARGYPACGALGAAALFTSVAGPFAHAGFAGVVHLAWTSMLGRWTG